MQVDQAGLHHLFGPVEGHDRMMERARRSTHASSATSASVGFAAISSGRSDLPSMSAG